MNSTHTRRTFISVLAAAGPVHIISMTETDTMPNLMSNYFVRLVSGTQVIDSTAAGTQCKTGCWISATIRETCCLAKYTTATRSGAQVFASNMDLPTGCYPLKSYFQVIIVVPCNGLVKAG